MEYFQKYIKYKNKYINLKNIICTNQISEINNAIKFGLQYQNDITKYSITKNIVLFII